MIRYYWEALFSVEYFPYWEFTMIMMLAMLLSVLWRLNRIERKVEEYQTMYHELLQEIHDIMEDFENE
jgi:hypothetical protein